MWTKPGHLSSCLSVKLAKLRGQWLILWQASSQACDLKSTFMTKVEACMMYDVMLCAITLLSNDSDGGTFIDSASPRGDTSASCWPQHHPTL